MSQPIDVLEVKLPPKPEYVGVARLTLSGVANRMGFSYDEIEDIKIAVSEAITNAVQHAYKKDDKGIITLQFNIYPEKLVVMVSDNGRSFDLPEVKKTTRPYIQNEPVEYMREGGLGLYLIETLMDEVKIHHQDGVIVAMTKFLNREQVEQNAEEISN